MFLLQKKPLIIQNNFFKNMAIDLIIGLQWGDEGKGKIVDILAPQYKIVARFNGGPNAGHTIEFDNKKFILHVVPSGIHRNLLKNYIGNGVVINPILLSLEIKNLEQAGINVKDSLLISDRAHIILPTHCAIDKVSEDIKGSKKIGSTGKGIGPTYKDKVSRDGLRMIDIFSDSFKEKYQNLKDNHLKILKDLYRINNNDFFIKIDSEEQEFFKAIEFLKNYKISDTVKLINDELLLDSTILAEGAQGVFLDIDHGSYPFVTSSSVVAGGVCIGLGVSPKSINKIYGASKAYTTRVGSGPFPTELFDEIGEKIRKIGNEFGSTTGRPRRCGWLDLVALKYACIINGVTDLVILKSDVLDTFNKIEVCIGYLDKNNKELYWPSVNISEVKPIYKSFDGWKTDTTKIRKFKDLPKKMVEYLNFISNFVNVPISFVSIGPDREQTIMVKNM